ncbi:hypothetical protein F5876DRAFT_3249, partial [Lentinula aff. lateritia]
LSWEERNGLVHVTNLANAYIEPKTYPGLQRNSGIAKEVGRLVPRPIVILVRINDQPVHALIDSGSLGDFMSTQLSDQLKVTKQFHKTPIPLHLAIQGSWSKIHCGTTVNLRYQSIHADHYFDIVNISNYDLILSTPWLFQYQVGIGLNPLLQYAQPICKMAAETPLPPLRRIKHTIPLIDENKIHPWHPSRCPEAYRPQWDQKRTDYVHSRQWIVTNSRNTVPMLLIPKAG